MRGAVGNTCPLTSRRIHSKHALPHTDGLPSLLPEWKNDFSRDSRISEGLFRRNYQGVSHLEYLCETTSPGLCNCLTVRAMAGTSEDCQRSTRRILGENILLVDDRLDGGVGTLGV